MSEDMLMIKELADHLKVREWPLCRLPREGGISGFGFEVAVPWRFGRDDPDAWIREQTPTREDERNET
jgi:hypothetical protein